MVWNSNDLVVPPFQVVGTLIPFGREHHAVRGIKKFIEISPKKFCSSSVLAYGMQRVNVTLGC